MTLPCMDIQSNMLRLASSGVLLVFTVASLRDSFAGLMHLGGLGKDSETAAQVTARRVRGHHSLRKIPFAGLRI